MLTRNVRTFSNKPVDIDTVPRLDADDKLLSDLAKSQDPYDIVITLTKIFDKLNVEYVVGGSIAVNFFTSPRLTKDVDMGPGQHF